MKIAALTLCFATTVAFGQISADRIVAVGTLALADAGSSSAIAEWYINDTFVSPIGNSFTIGGSAKQYNRLNIGNGQTFTASADMIVGPSNGSYNFLDIASGGTVVVTDGMRIGTGSISYFSTSSRVDVAGQLVVGGNLDLSNGYNATNNGLKLTSGGVAIVNGTLELYAHSVYGNCWLDLGGGSLALLGDQTATFAEGSGILTSIRILNESTMNYEPTAVFETGVAVSTAYFNRLKVEFVTDGASPFDGYTLIQAIPEPTVWTLLVSIAAIFALLRRRC